MKLTLASALSTLENRGFTRVPDSLLTLKNGNVEVVLNVDVTCYVLAISKPFYETKVGNTREELTADLDRFFTPEGVPYATEDEVDALGTIRDGLAEIGERLEATGWIRVPQHGNDSKVWESQGLRDISLAIGPSGWVAIRQEERIAEGKDIKSLEEWLLEGTVSENVAIKPEGRSERPLKPFDRNMDYGYAGAEDFSDGSKPLYADLNEETVIIVDANGLEIHYSEDGSVYATEEVYSGLPKGALVAIAEGIIREAQETGLNSTVLETYGFVRTV